VLDPAYKEHVNAEATQEVFYALTAAALKTLSGVVACLLDTQLNKLARNDWSRLTEVGDQSGYVHDMQRALKSVFPIVRRRLEDAPFRQFCDKFVRAFLLRYQASIYRCKKVGELGAQQLLLDAQAIRTMLLGAPSIRAASDKQLAALAADKAWEEDDETAGDGADGAGSGGAPVAPPAVYAKFVQKEVPRVELLLKIISTPRERFADTIKALWGEASETELARVMDLKGMNKKEQTDVLVALGRVRPTAAAAVLGGMGMGMGGLGLGGLGMGMMGGAAGASGSSAPAQGSGSSASSSSASSSAAPAQQTAAQQQAAAAQQQAAAAQAANAQGGGAGGGAGGLAAAAAKVGKMGGVVNLFGGKKK
jgi:hypothetical protein